MDHDCQYRPPHGTLSFDEDGSPVPLASDAPPPEPRDRIEEVLFESGVANSALVDRILAVVEDLARGRAAEAIHDVCAKLDGTAGGVALRRVLSGAAGDSLADAGNEAGVSKQCIAKHEAKIRKRLGLTVPL